MVSDLIGRFGIEGGLHEGGADARARLLKPGGRIVPGSVDLDLAPVEHADGRAHIEFWNARPAGFDSSPLRRWATHTGYPASFPSASLLGAPQRGATIDMRAAGLEPLTIEAMLTIDRLAPSTASADCSARDSRRGRADELAAGN
jgi:hypothetical protein